MADENEEFDSLDDMFADTDTEAEAVIEAEATPTEEVSEGETEPKVDAQASDEAPATTSEEEPEEPAAEPPSARTGQLAALLAERDKRQAAEKELQRLREQVGEEGEAPGVSAEQALLQTKIDLSKDVIMAIEPEFATKYEPHFMRMVVSEDGKTVIDEKLLSEFQSSPNPAKFALETAKRDIRVQEVNDPKFEENLRAQMRADILKELEDAGKEVSAVDVPDLTNTADGGSNSLPAVPQDESVSDMEFALDK